MWLLYNLLLTLTAPFWVVWMLWRTRQRGEAPNWRERQGDYRDSVPKKGDRPRLWVHTVSVGEFMASQPLLRELRKQLPDHEIILSVTTSSGHETARSGAGELYDYLVYAPIDVARFTLSAMQRVRPDALIVLETELWMNLFWAAKTFDAKIFVANARLSDRSFPRAKRFRFFYKTLLSMVDRVLAQTATDAERFEAMGAPRVQLAGNLKFDQALEGLKDDGTDWRQELGLDERPAVVLGSMRVEEFDVFAELVACDRAKQWVAAPRHLERTQEFVDRLQARQNCEQTIGYRSQRSTGDVVVLDSYGELAKVYAAASVAVIGGSFQKIGMQNLIQPMAFGKPVLHGPFTQNFRDVADLARKAGASIVCENAAELRQQLDALSSDTERQVQMGEAGRRLVEENRGAAARAAAIVASEVGFSRG